jgi:hypothetical protein
MTTSKEPTAEAIGNPIVPQTEWGQRRGDLPLPPAYEDHLACYSG